MSEEIDLNVNNLSATEEAFEVFQTHSMYTEDECLTLPVRECSQPAAEDAASEVSDMSIDNDIVSSTNIEDQSQQLSYCNLEVGSEVNITQEEPDVANLNLENEANSDPSYSNEMQEQSSGVDKDLDGDGSIEVSQTVGMETVSSSEVCNQTNSSSSKQGKGRSRGRGRRRGKGRGRGRGRSAGSAKKLLPDINSTLTNIETNNYSCANLSSQSLSDNTLETSNSNVDLVQSESNGIKSSPTQNMDTSIEEIPVVRRGRKKKRVSDIETSPKEDNSTSPKFPRKRGRPRKDSMLNIILQNPVPINGEAFSSTTSCSETKDLSEIIDNLDKTEENLSKMVQELPNIENIDEDDDDDICLSKLKSSIDCDNSITEIKDPILEELQEIPSSPLGDAELKNEGDDSAVVPSQQISQDKVIKESDINIESTDNVTVEEVVENTLIDAKESLLVEDVSKRPKRTNAKKALKYRNDDDSDEDPFANVELSDDDEPRRKKSSRYHSDDEYIPGRKGRSSSIDSSDSAVGDTLEELNIRTKKRGRKKKDFGCEMTNVSPKKAFKMDIAEDKKEPWRFSPKAAIEDGCDDTETKLIQPSNSWGSSNEFENFLAKKIQGTNLKIKKVSSSKSVPCVLAPLEIPVIDPNEVKKRIECSVQTNKVHTGTVGSQTSGPSTLSMKTNVPLNEKQSENACNFLKSIVKTTSELGQLMTQKSDDFIQKKINTANVVDTFKMDYCVKKSFLLLKLAKHNITQMEEDLSNQYEKFLEENELISYREEEKKIEPKPKKADSDSDCEIIEEPISTSKSVVKKESKPKFNPKTVFLNKELSIKIAKKPSEEVKSSKNINIKGRHTVWINDSVMVKKVKGSQSFLAQDSRNKKPPDSKITEKMVSDFFADYNRQKAIFVCASFISTEWFVSRPKAYVCKYFSVEPDKLTSGHISRTDQMFTNGENNATVSDSGNELSEKTQCELSNLKNPTTLLSICLKNLQEHFYMEEFRGVNISPIPEYAIKTSEVLTYQPKTLFSLCFNLTKKQLKLKKVSKTNAPEVPSRIMPSLKTLCHSKIAALYFVKATVATNSCASELNRFRDKILTQETIHKSNEVEKSEYCNNSVTQHDCSTGDEVKSLFSLCIEVIQDSQNSCPSDESNDSFSDVDENNFLFSSPKSLNQISFECLTKLLYVCNSNTSIIVTPNVVVGDKVPYKVKKLADLCFQIVSRFYEANDSHDDGSTETMPIELTINAVNTLSEEAFLNIEETTVNDQDNSDYYEDDGGTFYEDESMEPDYNENEVAHNENEVADNRENESWISQVQLKELKHVFVSDTTKQNLKSIPDSENDTIAAENYPLIANIKTEPGIEEQPAISDSFTPNIKTEPDHCVDQMTIIPESIVTKRESLDNLDPLPVGREPIVRQNSASFDEDNFEAFVRSNKMINAISNYENENEETFSQSALRIRRQHEPDSDNENDTSMSLLVPHTFEPLTVDSAKGSLLENSSSDSENVGKKNNKRKPIIKRKTKKSEPPKQGKDTPSKENKEVPSKENKEVSSKENKQVLTKENKQANTKDSKQVLTRENKEVLAKDKPIALHEVAVLTRRMRERIRLEEKKAESSESESENTAPATNQEKESKRETRRTRLAAKNNKPIDNEIQCNNVDSTEQLIVTNANKSKLESESKPKEDNNFTGFSAVDQNEISTYHKYVKYVYDQIIPKVNEETVEKDVNVTPKDNKEKPENNNPRENNAITSDVIHPDEPIELLECTPTMPMFDNDDVVKPKRKSTKAETKSPGKKIESNESHLENIVQNAKRELFAKEEEKIEIFHERDGWKCYPIHPNDTKLYEEVIIPLEKLPESFVQTYFEYQEISVKSKEDAEIDRLTNLQSLNRVSSVKKPRSRKEKGTTDENDKSNEDDSQRPESPSDADNYNELSPSEDEGANYDDSYHTPGPDATENSLAKSSLMDDDEDDDVPLSARKIKKDPDDDTIPKKKRPGPKSKTVEIKHENPESLMLTADKMMNKELTLLHAPVVLDSDSVKTPIKGPVTRNKPRSGTKNYGRGDHAKSDDSSSEEEKQWVNTKEKLLKRMGKRQESAVEDDVKRAKLVSEFIERRNDKPTILNHKTRGPNRRSRKKMLERQKQMRVLSYELLGESGTHIGKGYSAAYFKGRRNIRKVIDKKSLARSTVIANMDEIERKRRLLMKQKRLEELLGCEEGVNVIVTNDEVCLEYDFEVGQPAVTVHPFFTKVMKAHQYEGVKFMWDACFESIEKVQSGNPGGGCILAHCMGLGKTLQVLALLHTVLTHPKVGMHRVLVCCPLSTVLNWVDEIHKWIGPVTDQIKVFELSKLKKTYERAYQLEDWYSGGGIFIIGYELFRSLTTLDAELDDVRQTIIDKIRTALLDPGPDIIVCDEGHLLKNDCSVLAVAMSRVATRRRIVLTGTPMQNNLREYYCMVNFVKPNLLGTYAEYSNRFENPIMNGQHRDSQVEDIKLMKARTHILHKVLEGCLQRQEASVLYPYLPKKHEYTVFISLTKCQGELYKHYLNVYANKNKHSSILKDFHTLQKIWSHPLVLHNFNMKARDEKNKIKTEKMEDDLAREDLTASEDIKPPSTEVWWLQHLDGGDMLEKLDSSNKFMAVFRILEESVALDDKVLIFSTSLITMDALEYFLKKINNWSLGQEYYRLDGSVPPEVRQKWCREFNAEHNYKTKLFLISTRAGSLGLNMTAANRVIILDTSWNPAHDIQSIFRVYRFGQKKDCYIYRLVALGTMEQKIYERAVTKQAVSCRVVDEQQIDRHYNMAELTELYRFDETGAGVAGGVAVGVQDVVLLRVARDAALHAVHEHDSLLRGSEPALPEHERAAAWDQFQQEQHNQMQPDKVPKKEKKVNKRGISLEKPAVPAMPEVKTEPGVDNNFAPPAEPKSKRGRKIINCRIPIQASPQPQPSTSSQAEEYYVDKSEETDMVSKISQILVNHEFNNRNAARDLSKLITTVQNVVASGDLSQLPPGDEAAAKIAQILLRKAHAAPAPAPAPPPPMPALTDICNSPVQPPQRNKRDQPGDSLSDANAETITGDLNVKTRRRAALSAQKKFDAIADDIVIDLNDDDWRGDDDYAFAPTRNPEPEIKIEPANRPVKKYKPGPKSKKKTAEKPHEPAPPTRHLVESIQQSIEEESILLSDDEIVPEAPVAIKQEPDVTKQNVKKYPLHPSLLTNQNFVKIVAHTYLAGNPMLDEDAATLAARYSTSKALREVEATGKVIDSGPIYDIAVKVLGMDILEKLHNSGPAENSSTAKSKKAFSDTEKMLSDAAPEPEQKPAGRLKAKVTAELMPAERKPRIANLGLVKLTPVTPVIAAPVVVPVGLIKRAGPVGASGADEECILPDDDDVHVINDVSPPAPAPPARRNPRPPLVLHSIVSAAPRHDDHLVTNMRVPIAAAVTQPETSSTIKVLGNRMIAIGPTSPPSTAAPPASRGKRAPAPGPPPAAAADTICLDSDDEDAPAPPPVPVTLTAATSGMRLELQMPEETPLRTQPEPKSTSVKPTATANSKPSQPPKTTRLAAAPEKNPESQPKPKSSTVCKPGDIIRISKSGQVEVLNKVDSVPELVTRKARPGPASRKLAAPAPAPPAPAPAASPAAGAPAPAETPLRVSSSSSRSPSPADPLSILRDVVQIPADRYQSAAPADRAPDPPKLPPKKPDNKPTSLFNKLNALKASQSKQADSANTQIRSKKQVLVPKGPSVVVDSVDLTDLAPAPPPVKKTDKTKSSAQPAKTVTPGKTGKKIDPVATVVGKSKNIILSGLGKTNKVTVGPAPASSSKGSSVRVTNMETVSPAMFKRVDKKRPAIKLEPETPKRKKTEPMSLKDFNLDDIDDIIELE